MRLLVTGTGRSGTLWAGEAIRSAGVPCTHETAFTLDRSLVDGAWVAESSWLAAPFTPMDDTYVVHLVRHPLAVIASLANRRFTHNRYYDYAARHVPLLADIADPTDRCATYWVHWNRLIVAGERIRVEDVTAADVSRWAAQVDERARLTDLPPAAHRSKRPPSPVSWDRVAGVDGLIELATEVGYQP